MSGSRINPWLLFGLGAAGVMWLATRASAKTPGATADASGTGGRAPELPGSGAVTGAQVAQATDFWASLIPVQSLDSGYVSFPSGSQSAATLLPTRMSTTDGNYYVQWAGRVFMLGPQDASGNWPAQPVG